MLPGSRVVYGVVFSSSDATEALHEDVGAAGQVLVALEKVSDLIARPRRAQLALCSWGDLFGRSTLFVRPTADWRVRREIWSPTAMFDSRLLLLLRKLIQMGVVEGGTLMGAGGERVRDPDSSVQAEEDMVVEVIYDLKMVLLGDENISERCGDCFPGLSAW